MPSLGSVFRVLCKRTYFADSAFAQVPRDWSRYDEKGRTQEAPLISCYPELNLDAVIATDRCGTVKRMCCSGATL